jgi:hypothetical protein
MQLTTARLMFTPGVATASYSLPAPLSAGVADLVSR